MIRRLHWRGPPLALQILGLLLGGLVVAQVVTLLLTVMLPPEPKAQYGLDDIAGALRSPEADGRLERRLQPGPPDVSGGGWLMSERSRHELATLLGAGDEAVSLAFYTPLPFAGTAVARPTAALANDGPMAPADGPLLRPAGYLVFQPPEGGIPTGGVIPQTPPGGFREPPASAAIPHDGFPPGMLRGRGEGPAGAMPRTGRGYDVRPGVPPGTQAGRLYAIDPRPAQVGTGGVSIPGDGGAAVPAILGGGTTITPVPPSAATQTPPSVAQPYAGAAGEGRILQGLRPEIRFGGAPLARQAFPDHSLLDPARPGVPGLTPYRTLPDTVVPAIPEPAPVPAPRVVAPSVVTPPIPYAAPSIAIPSLPPIMTPARDATTPVPVAPYGPPIAIAPVRRSLFGLADAPFVEGDFVAALRLGDGRWAVVQPAAEPFPNAWQRRVLLWFAFAFAIVAPIGWLFAQRVVKPIDRFATAAEALGRDPSAAILPLDGPAEIGRAANAFNLMQSRLRSFVDDRTAMIGAISHDLRTPLTRMRFRIEDTEGEVRDGLLEEVDAMEAMITQVIAFIRDASVPGVRERLDLGTLVEDVVEDAQMIGGDVTLERSDTAPVEVDVLGIRRVLDNLLENAIKYGARARIRLTAEADSIVAEIRDDGPGLPDDELERAFEPFYRGETARASDKAGSGLGLAVCRSIARAHGGDVRLLHSSDGFVAEMRLPRAFGIERALAA